MSSTTPPWVTDLAFSGAPRPLDRVDEVIVHESVTVSHEATVAVLKRRRSDAAPNGLSTHIIIEGAGQTRLTCPLDQRALHCAGHNGPSVGIDLVSPYYPRHARRPWGPVIDAPWAHKGRYVLPTRAQIRSLANVLLYLHETLGISLSLAGVVRGRYRMGLMPDPDVRRPGIWAHHQAGSHADGGWPVLAAHLTILWAASGQSADAAYDEAVRLATGARSWIPLPVPATVTSMPERCSCCGQVVA